MSRSEINFSRRWFIFSMEKTYILLLKVDLEKQGIKSENKKKNNYIIVFLDTLCVFFVFTFVFRYLLRLCKCWCSMKLVVCFLLIVRIFSKLEGIYCYCSVPIIIFPHPPDPDHPPGKLSLSYLTGSRISNRRGRKRGKTSWWCQLSETLWQK